MLKNKQTNKQTKKNRNICRLKANFSNALSKGGEKIWLLLLATIL